MISSEEVHNGLLLKGHTVRILALLVTLPLSLFGTAAGQNKEALISDALSAAPPKVAKTAKVVDWNGTVLREGSAAYTCNPTPAQTRKSGQVSIFS